jgi:hypothetical protein
MALARCIICKLLGVVCHFFPLPLEFPTLAARRLHVTNNSSAASSESWNCGREWSGNFAEMTPFSTSFRDLLHAANLRHGTYGFTSPPKEDMLRILILKGLIARSLCKSFGVKWLRQPGCRGLSTRPQEIKFIQYLPKVAVRFQKFLEAN